MTKQIPGGVCAAKGFKAGAVHCGIRKNQTKLDLCLIAADVPCVSAAVYTQNLVQGAPITLTKKNLVNGKAQAIICNSGNANTCAAWGMERARQMCGLAGGILNIDSSDVIVASTGVIGQELSIEPIQNAAADLKNALTCDGSDLAARAIMTTDTIKKEYAVEFDVGGVACKMGGIAKGSGMICPDMATMLCFITTDVKIAPAALKNALAAVTRDTFNMVSVDGDTSTNDMLSVMASGLAGNPEITENTPEYDAFAAALLELCTLLATDIARDGEGATKLITCELAGAKDGANARRAAKAVISSSLVKAAIFGADANWGRVLCAIGYSGADTDVTGINVSFMSAAGSVVVCEHGAGLVFDEELAKAVLSQPEIVIHVTMKDGKASATAWGCDLTYDYVKINGDYRT